MTVRVSNNYVEFLKKCQVIVAQLADTGSTLVFKTKCNIWNILTPIRSKSKSKSQKKKSIDQSIDQSINQSINQFFFD